MSEYLVEKSKHSEQQKTMLAIQKKMDILNAIYWENGVEVKEIVIEEQ